MLARATFTRFQDSTEQDWKLIGQEFVPFRTYAKSHA